MDQQPNPNDFRDIYSYLESNQHDILWLEKNGDPEAISVGVAYLNWKSDKLNIHKQNELINVTKQFMIRDLTEATRTILQNRFGHKLSKADQ